MITIENSNPYKISKINRLSSYFISGVDEVGRGPLAGPVVACGLGAIFQNEKHFKKIELNLKSLGVTDSKRLTEKKRKELLHFLAIKIPRSTRGVKKFCFKETSFSFYLKELSPQKIDQINILQASLKAMSICIEKISMPEKNIFLVDGNKAPLVKNPDTHIRTLIKGDARSALIGLASIIAKEYRDQLMKRYDEQFPEYGFSKHSGYPTKFHKDTLAKLGPCPIHRQSFKGVKEWVGKDSLVIA